MRDCRRSSLPHRLFPFSVLLCAVVFIYGCAPTIQAPGPFSAPPRLLDSEIRTADGLLLPLRKWQPDGKSPTAVLIALHGFNDYSNFFDAPGKYFAKNGILSYAYDQRGFGETAHRGLWPGLGAFAADLKAAVKLVRARHPNTPLYVLGESMGGAVAMVTMTGPNPPKLDGVILAAPAVWGRATMPFYQRWALWLAAHTVPWMTLTGRGLKIKPSDNIEMLRKLGRDPLVIKETRVDAIHGLTNLMDAALDSSASFKSRALILYGMQDEVIPHAPTFLMLERLPKGSRKHQRIAIYDTGYHMLLRDLKAEIFWKDIAAWIADTSAPLPSQADARAAKLLSAR